MFVPQFWIIVLTAGIATALFACGARGATNIKVESTRIVSQSELTNALPPDFSKNEGVSGRIIGIEIRMNGNSLRKFASGSRTPIVRYVSCDGKIDYGYSFGPFISGKFAKEFLREITVVDNSTYSIIATVDKNIIETNAPCIVLEARSYGGVVDKSIIAELR